MAKTTPSIRQRLAIKKVMDSRGKKPVCTAMVEAGFSPSTAKNPKNLTESKAWKELMEQQLPDRFLARKHVALLNKKETRVVFDNSTGEWIAQPTGEVDTQAVSKGLDMAYKLKG